MLIHSYREAGSGGRIIDVSGQYATFFGSHRLLGLLQAGEDMGGTYVLVWMESGKKYRTPFTVLNIR